MASLDIRLLGGFRLERAGAPVQHVSSPRLQALLAYLLLHRDRPHPRAYLAYLLWPDSSEAQARTNLRQVLFNLRRALPGAERYLTLEGQVLQWQPRAPATLDVAELEEALARAEGAEEARPAVARRCLERAAALYCGDLLPDLYDDWLEPERERLRGLFVQALERLVRLLEAQENFRGALPYAQRLIAQDPLREGSYRRLMRLYGALGERAKALRVYHSCEATLGRELSLAPSPETRALYESVRQAAAAPKATRTAPEPGPLSLAPPAFVGRRREAARLLTLWQEARARGPALALISGDSGIGKTRLAQEIASQLRSSGQRHASTRCYAAEGAPAFAPVVALLRSDSLRHALAGLDAVWKTELVRLLPELAHPELPGPAPLHEAWQRQRFLEALCRAVLRAAPLLVLIDDLQWCDRDTLEWLHVLLRFDAGAELLIMGTARTHEFRDNPALLEFLSALQRDDLVHELELFPLDEGETGRLARSVEDGLEGEALRSIYKETEGNPLFVVEMVRGGQNRTGQLPPKLQAVIGARLGKLPPEAQALAARAAVVGREFSFDLLVKVSAQDEEKAVTQLDELWRQQLIRERGPGSYDFSHDKFREVIYDGLSETRKRLLHRATAEALEALYASQLDLVSGQIAAHYDRAGLVERAVPYYQRAADAARRLYAHEEATQLYGRALQLLETLPENEPAGPWRQRVCAQLHEGLADVYKLTGQRQEALAACREALRHLPEGEPLLRARLLRKFGAALAAPGRSREAAADAAAAFAEGEAALGSEPSEGARRWWQEWLEIQFARAWLFYSQQRWREIESLTKRIEPVVKSHGTVLQRGMFYMAVGRMTLVRERFTVTEASLLNVRKAFAAVQEGGNLSRIAASRFGYGFHLLWAGHLGEADREMRTALHEAERTGDRSLQARCLIYLTFLHRKKKNVRRTAYYAHKGLNLAADLRMRAYIGAAKGNLAWLAWRKGDPDAAKKEALEALEAWQAANYPVRWSALLPLMAAECQQGNHAEAITRVRALLEPQQQRLPALLSEELGRAAEAGKANRPERAKRHLERALKLAEAENLL